MLKAGFTECVHNVRVQSRQRKIYYIWWLGLVYYTFHMSYDIYKKNKYLGASEQPISEMDRILAIKLIQ